MKFYKNGDKTFYIKKSLKESVISDMLSMGLLIGTLLLNQILFKSELVTFTAVVLFWGMMVIYKDTHEVSKEEFLKYVNKE